jgi:predicted nucleic acid-binding protein
MADRFFDTSAAAKHYRAEIGTARVDAFLAEVGSRHFLSTLSVVELRSAFARLVRTGHITAADFQTVRGRLLADLAAGLWQVVPVTTPYFHDAQLLLVRHALVRSLRTLDALPLAAALGLHAAGPLDAFVCADANLGPIAAAEGLTWVNPEVP